MPPLSFEDYDFCPDTLALTRRGAPLKLRPKTAVILRSLLAEPGAIVSKATLLEAAWGERWVADQNLFQAISELRSAFAPLKPIVTYPNRGYAWTLPVRPLASRAVPGWRERVLSRPLAYGLSATLAAVMGFAVWVPSQRGGSSPELLLAPSIQAFQLGTSVLEDSPDQAAAYFRLALREDPEFLQAQLMLAQALYSGGLREQAKAEAQHLYLKAVDKGQDYLQVSVMGLLSRLDQAEGQPEPALQWAQSALDKAQAEGFACAASEARRRLVDLVNEASHARPASAGKRLADASAEALLADLKQQDNSSDCDPLLGDSDPFSEQQRRQPMPPEGGLHGV